MNLRLFFPLWSMTTILGENSSAKHLEKYKLQKWGLEHLLPHIATKKFKKYPFKIIIKFHIYSDIEMTSLLILSAYITNTMGLYPMQSDDYRVVPTVEVLTQRVCKKEAEGCEIIVDSIKP